MMHEPTTQVPTGLWWRFSRYRLRTYRAGSFVEPAPGARLESYDPWRDYESSRQKGGPPPYETLLDLVPRVVDLGSAVRKAPAEASNDLLEWCSHHGLLGVLPHRALGVRLAPRWARSPLAGPKSAPVPLQKRYTRTSAGWVDGWAE